MYRHVDNLKFDLLGLEKSVQSPAPAILRERDHKSRKMCSVIFHAVSSFSRAACWSERRAGQGIRGRIVSFFRQIATVAKRREATCSGVIAKEVVTSWIAGCLCAPSESNVGPTGIFLTSAVGQAPFNHPWVLFFEIR
jgi:hypothetical protein